MIFPLLAAMVFNHQLGVVPSNLGHQLGDYLFPVILAAGSLTCLLFAPAIGRLSDVIGRKKVLLLCTILTVISFTLPIAALWQGSLCLLILGNAVNGIASNNQPVIQAAIGDISPQILRKTKRFGIDTVVTCLGMTLGPIFGNALATFSTKSDLGQQAPFIIAAGLTLMSLLLLLFVLPETNTYGKPCKRYTFSFSLRSFSDIFKVSRSAKKLLFISFLVQAAWAQFFQYLYFYLDKYFHYENATITRYTSLLGIYLSMGLLLILPLLLKHFTLNRIIQSSCLCAGFALLLMIIPTPTLLWLSAVPLAISIGLYYPCLLTRLAQDIGPEDQGWIMAVNNSVISLSWLITGFTGVATGKLALYLPILICAALLFQAWLICKTMVKAL